MPIIPAQIEIINLINEVGPSVAVAIFAALTYFMIARRIANTRTDAQSVLNREFAKVQAENTSLNKRLDQLHMDMVRLRDDYMLSKTERALMARQLDEAHVAAQQAKDDLKAAIASMQELRREIGELRVQIATLENEKRRNAEALGVEREQVARLTAQNIAMQREIDDLKQRVSGLQGRNDELRTFLSMLKVVTVETAAAQKEPAEDLPVAESAIIAEG